MPRPALEEVRNIGNFAQNFRWTMKIMGANEFGLQDIKCVSSGVPKRTGASSDVTIRGHKVKQPGVYSYEGTITLTFVDTIARDILFSIEAWVEQCWQTNTGIQQSNNVLKSDVMLTLLDNYDAPTAVYTLKGCYPESFDPVGGDLTDGADAAIAKPTITLSYDYYIVA